MILLWIILGVMTLAAALILALFMGLRMARSIRTITTAAEAIERAMRCLLYTSPSPRD